MYQSNVLCVCVCLAGSSPSSAHELMCSKSIPPPNVTGFRPASTRSLSPSFMMRPDTPTASSVWAGPR